MSRAPSAVTWLGAAVAVLAACGGTAERSAGPQDLEGFDCAERRVEYTVVGGFVAAEAGVSVSCEDGNPRLTKWRLESGERKSSRHDLSAEQFEGLWMKIDATGWRYLGDDCNNPSAAGDDPTYSIVVGDFGSTRSLSCSGKELPFPYDRLVNELDLRAAGFGDEDDANRL